MSKHSLPFSSMAKKRIGFVGVGRMGANMARRLHERGHAVTAVYDRHVENAQALAAELGCAAPDTLAEVTRQADILFTVVTDDAAMRRIFTAKKDNLLTKAKGRIFINCATVTPEVHRKTQTLAQAAGAASLEACMASSIPQARAGTLYLMVAGDKRVFRRVEPLLQDLSASLRYIGEAGRAAEVKALVNMVMNINTAALAEGLGLGEALGLDLDMLREVFAQTGANSRVLETDGEDMQTRDHDCYFSAEHAAKDSGIALALGRKQRLSLPLAAATLAQYQRMVDHGLGHLDKSGVAELTFKGRGK
ncbi:MAG: NAD(P)-dependent oxidoreductase [Opitutales bacterium]